MDKNIILYGEKIDLKICTKELWHEFSRNYIPDPMMDNTPYIYDFEREEKSYNSRMGDSSRFYFAIVRDNKAIGRIYLKHMDREKTECGFGIALVNDSVKGQGFGSEAIKLLIDYAVNVLGFKTIKADSVLRNIRSQHVLEKSGFAYTHEDLVFKYYEKNIEM